MQLYSLCRLNLHWQRRSFQPPTSSWAMHSISPSHPPIFPPSLQPHRSPGATCFNPLTHTHNPHIKWPVRRYLRLLCTFPGGPIFSLYPSNSSFEDMEISLYKLMLRTDRIPFTVNSLGQEQRKQANDRLISFYPPSPSPIRPSKTSHLWFHQKRLYESRTEQNPRSYLWVKQRFYPVMMGLSGVYSTGWGLTRVLCPTAFTTPYSACYPKKKRRKCFLCPRLWYGSISDLPIIRFLKRYVVEYL